MDSCDIKNISFRQIEGTDVYDDVEFCSLGELCSLLSVILVSTDLIQPSSRAA